MRLDCARHGYTGTMPRPRRLRRLEYGIGYGYGDQDPKMFATREAAEEELADIKKWTTIEGAHLVVRDVSPWRRAS